MKALLSICILLLALTFTAKSQNQTEIESKKYFQIKSAEKCSEMQIVKELADEDVVHSEPTLVLATENPSLQLMPILLHGVSSLSIANLTYCFWELQRGLDYIKEAIHLKQLEMESLEEHFLSIISKN